MFKRTVQNDTLTYHGAVTEITILENNLAIVIKFVKC